MDSIDGNCTDAKREYENCFSEWFGRYLEGKSKKIPPKCEQLFRVYKECTSSKLSDILERENL